MMTNFLSIPEEILLLTIDSKTGDTKVDDIKTLDVVLAGAVLMHLAIGNRIDTDLEDLFYIDDAPFNNVVLDDAINEIKHFRKPINSVHWLTHFALKADEMKEQMISSLIGKGVLKVQENKVLWVFGSRKYPVKNNKQLIEVRKRVRDLVFSEDLPDLEDMAILSLVHYGNMEQFLFTQEESIKYKGRIEQLAKMDLIGQSISGALDKLSNKVSLSERTRNFFGFKTPEEKLDKLIEELIERYGVADKGQLPDWIRKGSDQYEKTLAFVTEKGTADIYYHRKKDKYFVRGYGFAAHTFGGGA